MMSDLTEELRTYKAQVQWLFDNHPETVGDYTQLDFQWLKTFGGLPYLELDAFKALMRNLGKLQNVERASRKLREGRGNVEKEKAYRRAIMRV